MGVEILELCDVAPSDGNGGSAPPPCVLPLAFFDLRWHGLPIAPERVFFYRCPTGAFLSALLPDLKRSLSLALRLFLPLAGCLLPDTAADLPCIRFSPGDSVPLTIARSDDDLHELTSGRPDAPARFRCLVPALPTSETSQPLMALQVTVFPEQGIAVGITAHHAAMDGSSSCHFMRTWASLCKTSQAAGGEPPFYDRSRILEGVDVHSPVFTKMKQIRSAWRGPTAFPPLTDVLRATFEVTAEQIESLRRWVEARAPTPGGARFSSFTLVVAVVWTCVLRARGGGGREQSREREGVIFPVDCRSRVEPPLPASYFGNGIVGCFVEAEGRGLVGEEGLAVAATAIREAVRGYPTGTAALRGRVESMLEEGPRMWAMRPLSVSGSTRMGVYEVDFGWGSPASVEMVHIGGNSMSLSETKAGIGRGVQIGVVLPTAAMREFSELFHATLLNACS